MRPEKQFLVDEVNAHLEKSDYMFLADYERATVPDIADLRSQLAKEEAEFHVIKNNILKVAAKGRGFPELDDHLKGLLFLSTSLPVSTELKKADQIKIYPIHHQEQNNSPPNLLLKLWYLVSRGSQGVYSELDL